MVGKKSMKHDNFNELLTALMQIGSQEPSDNQKIKTLIKHIIPEYENIN